MKMEQVCKDAGVAVGLATSAVEDSKWGDAGTEFDKAAGLLERVLLDTLCKKASCMMQMDRYGDALEAGVRAAQVSPSAAEPRYWQAKAHETMGNRQKAGDAYKQAARFESDLAKKMNYSDSATRCLTEVETAAKETKEQLEEARKMAENAAQAREKMDISAPLAPAAVATPTMGGMKMDWYQNPKMVNVDIMCKGVNQEKSVVKIEEGSLTMTLVRDGKDDWKMHKDLFEEVDPAGSRWSVGKYKVEVHLKKKKAGPNWPSLDKDAEVASATVRAGAVAARRMKDASDKQKGWEKTADDELKDYKEDDSAMGVFKDLYAQSDEETRRAMIKSYSESGGQVLSTNWGEVKKEKVTYTPMEDRDKKNGSGSGSGSGS